MLRLGLLLPASASAQNPADCNANEFDVTIAGDPIATGPVQPSTTSSSWTTALSPGCRSAATRWTGGRLHLSRPDRRAEWAKHESLHQTLDIPRPMSRDRSGRSRA